MTEQVLLDVRNLRTEFKTGRKQSVTAVNGVSFQVRSGEIVGLVGESGCGKSVTSLSIMQLFRNTNGRVTDGQVLLKGKDLLTCSEKEMRAIRGKEISMIFQEPMTALDPMYTIGEQINETLRFHTDLSKAQMREVSLEMLRKVKIPRPEQILVDYPHHLSGGMLQRVMIAIALINNPRLLIADEPTTALDVTIQAQILDLMNELRESYDTSVIMITHDLGVIAETCEEVAVFYAGQVVERASVDAIFHETAHPYTTGLLRSVTSLGGARRELYTIRGTVPTAGNFGAGCRFADRCDHCMAICKEKPPALTQVAPGHLCRCWLHAGGAEQAEKEAAV